MANTTCANCSTTLDNKGSPIEDPLNSAGGGAANRFCTPRCRNVYIERNYEKGKGKNAGNNG